MCWYIVETTRKYKNILIKKNSVIYLVNNELLELLNSILVSLNSNYRVKVTNQ